MEDERIVKLLSDLLGAPLSPQALARLLYPTADDFVPLDHLSFLDQRHGSILPPYYLDKLSYGSSRDSRTIRSLTSVDGREAHIHNRLGHISVNPNDPYNTSALIHSYKFVDDDPLSANIALQTNILKGQVQMAIDDDEPKDICVNRNFVATKQFVDTLIYIAEQQDKLLKAPFAKQDGVLMQQRALLLHAHRGAGKTFYENYILSRFSIYFDRHNTIWVRINLVEDIGYDNKLLHWINAQTAKIIMRYYDTKSMYFPKSRQRHVDVDKYISEHMHRGKNKSFKRRIKRQYLHACTIFRQGGHRNSEIREERISDDLIPPEIAVQVVAAARAAGFKFIVVLDGLDILEITKTYRLRFNNLTQQCMELTKSTKRNGFALLVVTRTNTLRTVLRADYHTTFDQAEFEQYIIQAIPLPRIIQARLQYIVSEITAMHRANHVSWPVGDLESHIQEYNEFLHTVERIYGSATGEKFINVLEKIQGSNNRAKVQMLQYRYYDFFARRRTVKGQYHAYQLVESLMKAGRRFPPIPYRYSVSDGEHVRTTWHTQRYDSRFFPSIFRFPFNSLIKQVSKHKVIFDGNLGKPRLENLLLGLRILQLVDAHHAYNRKRQRVVDGETISNKVTVGELTRVLRTYFGYEEGLTLRMVDEFVEYQIIEYHHPNIPVASNRQEDNEIVVLPKLGFLLDRFLYDLAYLNMAAIRIPLARSAFDVDDKSKPYFHAVSYEEPKDGLGLWVAAKLCNAVGLVRLLKWGDQRQEAEVRARIAENKNTDQEWCAILETAIERGLHYFLRDTEKNLLHETRLALTGIQLPLMTTFIHEYVSSYCSSWGDERGVGRQANFRSTQTPTVTGKI
jgi:hypothetical protein